MPDQPEPPVLALDGPSGTGKGTVGRLLAGRLGWHYLDSGAVYRVFAYLADKDGILPEEEGKLTDFSRNLEIRFDPDPAVPGVYGNGADLTQVIRTERCGELASRYAAVPSVRTALLALQRGQQRPPGLVADGRDMGSTVFPAARIKIYLDASASVRAERRYKQLKEKGFDVSLARLRQDMAERDRRDASRAASPLAMPADAVRIDTSDLTIAEVVERVMHLVSRQLEDGAATR